MMMSLVEEVNALLLLLPPPPSSPIPSDASIPMRARKRPMPADIPILIHLSSSSSSSLMMTPLGGGGSILIGEGGGVVGENLERKEDGVGAIG